MAEPTVMSYSRTYPTTVEDAYAKVIDAPLNEIFDRRYRLILPIKGTDGPSPWGTQGQERTVRMVGGGSMHETLTMVESPRAFTYRLDDITGPLKTLLASVDGEWAFTPAGTGVRITWTWWVTPRPLVTGATMRLLVRLWRGFAALGFERIEELLVPA